MESKYTLLGKVAMNIGGKREYLQPTTTGMLLLKWLLMSGFIFWGVVRVRAVCRMVIKVVVD